MYLVEIILVFNFIYVYFLALTSEATKVPLNQYIEHFEPLQYDPLHLHKQHTRIKRSLEKDKSEQRVKFQFTSHNKIFKVHLFADSSNFPSTTFSMDGRVREEVDLSHLYTGYLEDEPQSRVAGSIIDGIFSGFISLPQETFYIEKSWLYFDKKSLSQHIKTIHNSNLKLNFDDNFYPNSKFSLPSSSFHSVIYSSQHVNHDPFRTSSDENEKVIKTIKTHNEDDERDGRRYNHPRNKYAGAADEGDTSGCGLGKKETYEWMKKIQSSAVHKKTSSSKSTNENEKIDHNYSYTANTERSEKNLRNHANFNNRKKRDTTTGSQSLRRTCSLYLQTDYTLWNRYHVENADDAKTKDELTALLATHVAGLNDIYTKTFFDYNKMGPYNNFNFVVHRIQINTSASCQNKNEGFCRPNLDASSFLNIHSLTNHDDYCLAFVFSFRQFSQGTIGLAWVGSPVTYGGVCERWKEYALQDVTQNRSLNSGIVTLSNYNSQVPLKVSIITLAHEIGHNFGAQHDSGEACVPLLNNPNDPKGNYIMFASATSGRQPNNVVFSPCSIGNITNNLHSIFTNQPNKINCFKEREDAFCGNKIVEYNAKKNISEECDCGWENECDDKCCNPRPINGDDSKACTRAANALCSMSEGPCCDRSCSFTTSNLCLLETECSNSSYCDGSQVKCPAAKPKPDSTPCNHNTQACFKGECSKSICWRINWSVCNTQASSNDRAFSGVLCFLSCLNPATNSCISTGDKVAMANPVNLQLKQMLDSLGQSDKGIQLPPGAPCDNYRGYCDVFMKCRSVDEEGPLTQLKKLIINEQTLSQIREWVKKYPWVVVLASVGFIIFMALFIKLFAVHTPSSNPKLEKARKIGKPKKPQPQPEIATISASHQNYAYDPDEDAQVRSN